MKQKLNFGSLAALFDLHAGVQPELLPAAVSWRQDEKWHLAATAVSADNKSMNRGEGRASSLATMVRWCHRQATYWTFAYLIKSIILMRLRYKMLNDNESICVALLAVACGVCVMSTNVQAGRQAR